MKCERCLREEARFRVRTDLIDMKVCAACAAEAQRLGLVVEPVDVGEAKNDRDKSEFAVQDWRLKLSA
jgi:hypothetical protein